MPVADIPALLARLAELEQHNQQLRQQLDARAVPAENSATLASERYQFLFNAMDEGFCIIEFLDGPHGPLSDYIHVEANPAYTAHAGIANIVGKRLREVVGDEPRPGSTAMATCCAPAKPSASSRNWWPRGVTWS